MSKQEITVTCFFTDEGEDAAQIIFHSFELFLKRELTHDAVKFELSGPAHV